MTPNIIIIYADDLGFGDLGCYGGKGIPTPHLDKMATEGACFHNAYATASTCTPSRYSLLTGNYPWRNPCAQILRGDASIIIGNDEPTIPKILAEAGYRSGVVGKWHLGLGNGTIDWNGEISPNPTDIGFDESYIMAGTNDRVPCVYVKGGRVVKLDPADPLKVVYQKENPFPDVPTGRTHPELLKVHHSDEQHWDTIINGVGRIGFSKGGKSAHWDDETMSDHFLGQAKDFISRNKETPFFLYYALHQPHAPRIPGPRFKGATGMGPRGDVIAELDDCVGQLLAHLKEEGLDDNTMVIFSSDNGPILNDGYADQACELAGDHKPAGPLRGGKYSVFDGGTRVPMIVRAPGLVPPGKVSEALFSHIDFPAAFCEMAGVERPSNMSEDSQNLWEVLTLNDPVGRESVVTEGMGAKTVFRKENWVYIPPYEGPAISPQKGTETGHSMEPQLYDLSADIGQRENLSRQFPEKVKSLHAELETIQGFPLPNPPVTP